MLSIVLTLASSALGFNNLGVLNLAVYYSASILDNFVS